MTTMTSTPTSTVRVGPIGVATALIAATLATLFAHETREALIVAGIIALATVGIFGYVVPRALRKESAGGTALGLAIAAAVLVAPAFWSGLPFVLGVAAVIVGNAGRQARSGASKCIVALVLAALTVLFYLSIYVMEGIAGNTGFLFS